MPIFAVPDKLNLNFSQMKKFSALLLSLMMLLPFASCGDDDVITDYYPIILTVEFVNRDNRNLLDPETQGNLLDEIIKVKCDGVEYEVDPKAVGDRNSRYYLPTWSDPYVGNALLYDGSIQKCIIIGEFDGAKNDTKTVTISVRDKNYVLSFTNKIKGNKVKRQFYLDGKPNAYDGSAYIINVD